MAAREGEEKLTLYNYFRSSASWRVRLALAYKDLDYEYIPVPLLKQEQRTAEYKARNPMAQVPTLVVEQGETTVNLTQSLAIIEYLEETHPGPVALLPGDAVNRARCRAFAETVNSGIQPLQNLAVLEYLDTKGIARKEWVLRWVEAGLAALEQLAVQFSTNGRFAVGDAVSVADLCLVPQLYASRRFDADLSKFPTLLKIEQHLATLPQFIKAHADHQPDTPPPA